ncbi:MAG: hypothetical protein HKL82_07480 [Acidimicrobiaceae bacterium]|nr:hypothetical protein [Acidimicrobiaceae bacterium]
MNSALKYLGRIGKELIALDQTRIRFVRIQLASDIPEGLTLFTPFVLNDWIPADPFDPARPELVEAESISPLPLKRSSRKIKHTLAKMTAPEDLPPLWLAGPSVKYSTMTGDSPSVALLHVGRKLALVSEHRNHELQIGFPWRGGFHSFPFAEEYADLHLPDGVETVAGRRKLKPYFNLNPGSLLIAFSAPEDGYCRKLVVKVLPKL